MAHSLSAKKRIRQNVKSRSRNRWRKRTYRELRKDYEELLLHGSAEDCQTKLSAIYKTLDQIAAKGTIHKNTARRHKSRLAKRLSVKQGYVPASA